jgi:hypothetical protein
MIPILSISCQSEKAAQHAPEHQKRELFARPSAAAGPIVTLRKNARSGLTLPPPIGEYPRRRRGPTDSDSAAMPEQLPDSREMGRYVALAQVGMEMVVPVGIGILLAVWLDWGPWPVIVGAALGLVGGLAHMVRLLNRSEKQDKTSDDQT